MTIFTVRPDGQTPSTSDLDARFAEVDEMKTKDAFGRPDTFLLAQQAEARANAFEMYNRQFGEGGGMAGEWFARAARLYSEHAESMMMQARRSWGIKVG